MICHDLSEMSRSVLNGKIYLVSHDLSCKSLTVACQCLPSVPGVDALSELPTCLHSGWRGLGWRPGQAVREIRFMTTYLTTRAQQNLKLAGN